jgi:hypothetical protein
MQRVSKSSTCKYLLTLTQARSTVKHKIPSSRTQVRNEEDDALNEL